MGKLKCLSFIVSVGVPASSPVSEAAVICLSWAYSRNCTVEHITHCNAALPLVFILVQIMPQSEARGWHKSSVVHKFDAVKHSCDGVLLLAEATPL